MKQVREEAPPGWLQPSQPAPAAEEIIKLFVKEPPVPIRNSALEPFRGVISQWHGEGYKPTQIFRKLKDLLRSRGDAPPFSVGGVKRLIRRLGRPRPEVYVALHFEPGEAAQVDFGSGPEFVDPETGKTRKSHVFVMTLCYSRHMYAELVWDQSVPTWLRCHQNAFEAFGGVPKRVIIDNLKAAILRASIREPLVQKSYLNFAGEWGFKIEPNPPRTPRQKGRVESSVKYISGAVFCIKDENVERTRERLDEFVYVEAGNRIHGSTHQRPLDSFENEEKARLQPLPSPIPEMSTWSRAKMDTTCHLYFEKSHYSAPHPYVGQTLLIKAGLKLVEIYDETQRVAVHARATRFGTYRTGACQAV